MSIDVTDHILQIGAWPTSVMTQNAPCDHVAEPMHAAVVNALMSVLAKRTCITDRDVFFGAFLVAKAPHAINGIAVISAASASSAPMATASPLSGSELLEPARFLSRSSRS